MRVAMAAECSLNWSRCAVGVRSSYNVEIFTQLIGKALNFFGSRDDSRV